MFNKTSYVSGLMLLLAVSLTAAGSSSQSPQQERPGMSEEERRKVMERLLQQMKRPGEAPPQAPTPQQPVNPPATAPQAQPASPVPSIVQRAPMGSDKVQLTYDNADLYEFINQIADTLGITPIVIDPEVKGSVTIHSSAAMSKQDIFPLFNLILKNNNAALVKQGNIYQIVPISAALKRGLEIIEHAPPTAPGQELPKTNGSAPEPAPQAAPPKPGEAAPQPAPPGQGTPPGAQAPPAAGARAADLVPVRAQPGDTQRTPQLATHVIRVEFVPVRDLIEPLKLFMTEGGVIMPYERLNMLIVTDYSDSINKILEIIRLLDDNYLNPDLIELVKIKNNASADLVEDLKKIFGAGTKESATGIYFVSLDRLNAILVMANSKRALEEVKRWIKELDATTGRSVQTYVYVVENSTASNIAMILSALYGGEGGGTAGVGGSERGTAGPFGVGRTPQSNIQGGLVGGTGTSTFGSSATGGGSFGTGSSMGGTGTFGNQGGYGGMGNQGYGGGGYGGFGGGGYGGYGGGFGGGFFGSGQQLGPRLNQGAGISSQILRGGTLFGLQDNVRLVTDELNNSLIIQATPADYTYLAEVIKKLDVLPRQAIIDARIFEVDLNDSLTFGVSASLQARGTDSNLTTASIGAAAGALSANTFAFIGNAREILLKLDALRLKTNVRILEAPSVLALDGTVARIVVGGEVPYPVGSLTTGVTTGGPAVVSSIQYRDTGVSLIVMPRISVSGTVTLDVAQEVSALGAPVENLGPSFNKTSVATTLAVKDGETVAIAGLIRSNTGNTRSGVPFLSEIPLLGSLFGRTTRTATRTELLIMLTPHVIRTPERFEEMTQELKDSLRNVRGFVDDTQKQHTEDMEDARKDRVRKQEQEKKNK